MSALPPDRPAPHGVLPPVAQGSAARIMGPIGHSSHRPRYHELFDLGPGAQAVTDLWGIILEANFAAAELFGRSRGFLLGKPLGLLLNPESRSRFYQCLAKIGAGWVETFEARTEGKPGQRVSLVRAFASEPSADDRGLVRWLFVDITQRKCVERAQNELMARLVASQENERRRISREIHDQLGQELTALSFSLRNLEAEIPEDCAARKRLPALKELVDRLGREVHELAFELRPAALDDLGLEAAIEGMIQRWSERVGIAVGFHYSDFASADGEKRVASKIESALYRVIQEALNNVAKHAGATTVSVIVEQGISHVMALVEDNGRGFNPEAAGDSKGLGLLGMYERLSVLGGSLQIESSLGGGTTIRARIPITRAEALEP
jgi:PAS domain S-box-containing protein